MFDFFLLSKTVNPYYKPIPNCPRPSIDAAQIETSVASRLSESSIRRIERQQTHD